MAVGEWVGLRTGNHAHFLLTYHFICLFFSQHILSIPSQSYPEVFDGSVVEEGERILSGCSRTVSDDECPIPGMFEQTSFSHLPVLEVGVVPRVSQWRSTAAAGTWLHCVASYRRSLPWSLGKTRSGL
jgi:hypothetical protein